MGGIIPFPWNLLVYAGVLAAITAGGCAYKNSYDSEKIEIGRAEVTEKWEAEKEAARIRNRIFDAKQAADDRELEKQMAAIRAVNAKITKGQYDERDSLIEVLRNRELLADAAIAQLGMREPAAKPSTDLPAANATQSCVDVASRATGYAIECHRAATANADQVDALQGWIRRLVTGLKAAETPAKE